MIYELRIYKITPGRLGDIRARFSGELPAIFARHGIKNVARWSATAGKYDPAFIYMMEYRSLDEREEQWARFYDDPNWKTYRAATNNGEEMVERIDIIFLKKNALYHDISEDIITDSAPVYELVFAEVEIGMASAANDYLLKVYMPLIQASGGRVGWVADVISGENMPKIAIISAWKSAAERGEAHRAVNADSGNLDAIRAQRRALKRPAIGNKEVWLMEAADFASK